MTAVHQPLPDGCRDGVVWDPVSLAVWVALTVRPERATFPTEPFEYPETGKDTTGATRAAWLWVGHLMNQSDVDDPFRARRLNPGIPPESTDEMLRKGWGMACCAVLERLLAHPIGCAKAISHVLSEVAHVAPPEDGVPLGNIMAGFSTIRPHLDRLTRMAGEWVWTHPTPLSPYSGWHLDALANAVNDPTSDLATQTRVFALAANGWRDHDRDRARAPLGKALERGWVPDRKHPPMANALKVLRETDPASSALIEAAELKVAIPLRPAPHLPRHRF